MTVIEQEHPQRERTAPPQDDQRAAHANRQHAAEQRNAAAAVNTAVAAARVERTRARHLGADVRRLAEAFKVLSEQINGRDDMTVLAPENVLRHAGGPEQGTGNMAAVCEFVARIMAGQLPFDALEEMHDARLEQHLAPAVRHADATYQHAHRLEHSATVQPALPPAGPQQAPQNGAPQRREPIAPSQPPMFPPAPPETLAEQTGAMVARHVEAMRNGGMDVKRSQAALASLDQVVPVFEVDQSFSPVSIPQQRDIRDTQRLPMDEVLKHLAQDDAGAEPDDDPEPRPFSGTGLSGDASPARDSGADDDES